MFCAYLVYRLAHFNAFAAASQQLNVWLGAVNTAVLLVSSVTVVLAVKAAQEGSRKQLVSYLVVTVLLGLTFLGIKGLSTKKNLKNITCRGRPSTLTSRLMITASRSR